MAKKTKTATKETSKKSNPFDKKQKMLDKLKEQEIDIAKVCEEKGYDIGFDFDIEKETATPKVRLIRKATVRDSMNAEHLARKEFAIEDNEDGTPGAPTPFQMMVCKLAIIGTFNGKVWNVQDIGDLTEDFFSVVALRYLKFLS